MPRKTWRPHGRPHGGRSALDETKSGEDVESPRSRSSRRCILAEESWPKCRDHPKAGRRSSPLSLSLSLALIHETIHGIVERVQRQREKGRKGGREGGSKTFHASLERREGARRSSTAHPRLQSSPRLASRICSTRGARGSPLRSRTTRNRKQQPTRKQEYQSKNTHAELTCCSELQKQNRSRLLRMYSSKRYNKV